MYEHLSMARVHPRFEQLIGERKLSKLYIQANYNFLDKFPLSDTGNYEILGKYVSKLRVSSIDEPQELLKLLAPFTNLTALRLWGISLPDNAPIEKFPQGAKKLILEDRCQIGKECLTKLFQKLNPTLHKLVMESYVCPGQNDALKELQNIKDVYICLFPEEKGPMEFLRGNKELAKVHLRINGHLSAGDLWELCAQLPMLRVLNLQFNREVDVPQNCAARINQVEELTISLYGIEQITGILDRIGTQLKRFTIEAPMSGPNFVRLFSRRFPNLQHLRVAGYYQWSEEDMRELMAIKSLTHLSMDYKSGEQKKHFVSLIKQLPLLVEFECKGMFVDKATGAQLRFYLKEMKRDVQLVGVTFRAEDEGPTYVCPASYMIADPLRYQNLRL